MTLFELEAKLGLNKDGFDKGVRDAEGSGKDLRDSLTDSFGKIKTAAKTLLGAAIFKGIIDAARDLVGEMAQVGDTIDKQSQVLGMSRKAYQEWDYILSQNGASIENLGAAMRGMNKIFMSAKEGNEEANDALAQLGVNVHELEMMEPEEQFETLVRAFQKMPAGAQKTALAMQIFGRSGMQLLPLLNSNADSIDTLRENAEELGLIMGDDAIDASVKYTDSLDTMQRTFNAFKYAIGSKLLPILTKGMEKITAYAGKLRKAYEQSGFAGVFSTLINDIKEHLPTWEDIKSAAIRAWGTIKNGFKNIAKLILGTDGKGNIKFPTWKDVKTAAENAWKTIKKGFSEIAKLILGTDEKGDIKFPTWEDLQEAAQTAWDTIVEGAKTLTGFVFGDIGSANDLLLAISTTWTELKTTITNGAIKLGTWLFGEGNEDKIASAIQIVADALPALLTAITTFVVAKKVEGGFKAIKDGLATLSAFTSGVGKFFSENKLAIILAGIATAITLIIEHWDEIEPVLREVGQWIDEYIIQPVSGFFEDAKQWLGGAINDIKRFLGLRVEGELTQTEANQLEHGYRQTMSTDGALEESGWLAQLQSYLEKAGFKADEVDAIVNSIVTADDPEWVAQLLRDLTNSVTKAQRLEEILGNIQGSAGMISGQYYNHYYSTHSHAKGLWSVPQDNYYANLHRGEMVLTASQARRYREGRGDVDYDLLFGGIRGAIRDGMDGAQVNSYMDSTKVTNKTNNVTGRRLMARRFAPV